MAHHYSNYFSAQSKLCIIVGKPFDFTDLYELYKEDPNKAIAQLNQRAHDKVKELMLDISDREHYEQYEMLCSVNRDRQMKIMKLRKSYFPLYNPTSVGREVVKEEANAFVNFETVSNISIYMCCDKYISLFQNMIY